MTNTLNKKDKEKRQAKKTFESLLIDQSSNTGFVDVINTVGLTDFYKANSGRESIFRQAKIEGTKGELIISSTSSKANTKLVISDVENENFKVIPVHTKQTLRIIMKYITQNNTPTMIMPLSEFMEKRGLTHESRARAEILQDLDLLMHTTIAFDLLDFNGKCVDTIHRHILGATGRIKDGIIRAEFDRGLYDQLLGGLNRKDSSVFLTSKSDVLDRINFGQSSLGYTLGELIEEYLSHNKYDKKNGYAKRDNFVISVKNILQKCKELPTKDEIMQHIEEERLKGNKNIKPRLNEKIVQPVENALNKLMNNGLFPEWTYCHAKGAPLTDNELGLYDEDLVQEDNNKKYYGNYEVWETLYIKIIFPDNYPIEDHDKNKVRAVILENERKKQAKRARKARKAKKAQQSD